jgi:hypothetical protein
VAEAEAFLFVYAKTENGGKRKGMGERRWEEIVMAFVEKDGIEPVEKEEENAYVRVTTFCEEFHYFWFSTLKDESVNY